MRITIAAAVAALVVSAPVARAATPYDDGWARPAALGSTAAHPMRAAHQASGLVSGANWGRGLAYTGVDTNIGGPAGGFADQSPG